MKSFVIRHSKFEIPAAPSSLYRANAWRWGLAAVRLLPPGSCVRLTQILAGFYWRLSATRRETVIQNLLPALRADRCQAEMICKSCFQQFARKLVDLWRVENGLPAHDLVAEWRGLEHFDAAQAQGRGILLITPHLGNWELGGPLLAARGLKIQVITQMEPDERLTQLRRAARAKWGIETLILGQDEFGFIEVIRRLESGAIVALLIDRPPPATAVNVELFGKPFAASIAAAELARASGCALVPVALPWIGAGYRVQVSPPVAYDRAALGNREARRVLTQQIIRVFEPAILQYLDQWYHFVPVWPKA